MHVCDCCCRCLANCVSLSAGERASGKICKGSEMVATRRIAQGEQIVFSYLAPAMQSHAMRKVQVREWYWWVGPRARCLKHCGRRR